MSRTIRRALWLSLAGSLVLVQVVVRGPSANLLWSSILNAGHAPLFGAVALVLWRLFRPADGAPAGHPIRPYLAAFLSSVIVGVAAELLQKLGGGDAEAVDVARDAAGAAASLLIASVLDRRLKLRGARWLRWAAFPLASLLTAAALFPLAATVVDFAQRDAAFPSICRFGARWERRFLSGGGADVVSVEPPAGWRGVSTSSVARVTFQTGVYPGFTIREPYPDWRGFRELVFDAFSDLAQPVQLVLRVHDRDHNHDYHDRFNRIIRIEPGMNRISVPLVDVRSAPRDRRMDMSRIWGVVLFADHPREPFVLYLGDLRLR